MKSYTKRVALMSLNSGAIKLSPTAPFTWASGMKSPIYNDNRLLMNKPEDRNSIASFLTMLIKGLDIPVNVIAGVSTGGIGPGYGVADRLGLEFVYVRDKPKSHGLVNLIECVKQDVSFDVKHVVVIEDLISTGKSSAKVVQALRSRDALVQHCVSIFTYELPIAADVFAGKAAFGEDNRLSTPCHIHSLLTFTELLEVAAEQDLISHEEWDMLAEWKRDPQKWSDDWIKNNARE